jgi:hypothetical protein
MVGKCLAVTNAGLTAVAKNFSASPMPAKPACAFSNA